MTIATWTRRGLAAALALLAVSAMPAAALTVLNRGRI